MKVLAVLAGVVSALAVVTAGTAAVQALITGAQIKDGTVESRDIKNGTVTRLDIANAAEAALQGQRGPRGAAGARGVAGPIGAAGPQGATGAAGPQGPAGGQGAQGPKGETGEGLNVTGSVPEESDLLDLEAEVGDAYIVALNDHLYIWDGEEWVDAGLVRGPVGPQGATGPAGPQGPSGPIGPTGPAGDDGGLAGYLIVPGAPVAIASSDFDVAASVACPAGKLAIGGGVDVGDSGLQVDISESYPIANGSGWNVTVHNYEGTDNTMTPYAVCANAA
jgi:hypothetical protein